MGSSLFAQHLQNKLFIVSSESYKSNSRIIERYLCKHPLLTPEMIVVNDQLMGFKSLNRRFRRLEQFSIFCEIEYEKDTHSDHIEIFHFELYSEISTPMKYHAQTLEKLCQKFNDSIAVHRVKQIGIDDMSTFVIYSKIDEALFDDTPEQFESEDNIFFFDKPMFSSAETEDEDHFDNIINYQISNFTKFIKIFDKIFLKEKEAS